MIKKFWSVIFSFLFVICPVMAGPLIIGGIAGIGVIAGFSIYRSVAPVDMADALNFFSTCWSCQMFGDIISAMSDLLPRAYSAIGGATIPIIIALTAIWFGWNLLAGYIGVGTNKKWATEPWGLAGDFGTHLLKLGLVVALLLLPLPRMISDVAIAPVYNVGLTLNHIADNNTKFNECVVATALADNNVRADARAATFGAYSPKLRHNLTCQLASVHQMTALGMTVGWTMLNMAFAEDYMHHIMWGVPIFPNVPILLVGALVLLLFFFALLPVPIYMLEVFIKLSLDLIMLPLMLIGWVFSDWKIVEFGGKNIKSIIDESISGIIGIALVGIFVSFATMFFNAAFGNWNGASVLKTALEKNDATILMDGLLMNNDSLITIILMGLFIAMFMTSIVALIKTFFNVAVPEKYYETLKKDIKTIRGNAQKWWKSLSK